MLANTIDLVREARSRGIAIGAFNTYNLELTRAIVAAAEKLSQPIILQLGVPAIKAGGEPLALATLAAARVASVPVAVHLDHCPDIGLIEACFAWGFSSALADGSRLPFVENIAFTKRAVEFAARYSGTIEAELGYLAGTEDGVTVEEVEASLTDPTRAHEFIAATGAAMLAVSIGNAHGYVPNPPPLDFARLAHWLVKHPWTNSQAKTSLPELRITKAAYPEPTRHAIEKYIAASDNENERVQAVLRFVLLV